MARRVEFYDMPTIRQIVADAENGGQYSMQSLIVGVVTSDAFRMKRATELAVDQVYDQ